MPSMLIRHHAMYYQDVGSGFPILFGHSYLWDRKMWQHQVQKLSQNYRCIVPDLWSHGFSEEIPQRPYSLEQLSDDFYYLMKSIGCKEFAVVGLSVGGMWGTHLALKHPEAVKALVLMDTFVGDEPIEKKAIYLELLANLEKTERFTDEIVEAITPFFFSQDTLKHNHQLVQSFKSHLKKIPHERLAGVIELGHTIFNRVSMLSHIPKLQMPVMITCGSEDIPRPPSEAKMMADLIPHSCFETIPKAGHIASLEQPLATNDLIESFLVEALDKARLEVSS